MFAEGDILGRFLPLTRSMYQVYESLCSGMLSILYTVGSTVYHIACTWDSKHLVHFTGQSTAFITWGLGDDSGHLWAGVYIPEAALWLDLEMGSPDAQHAFSDCFPVSTQI